VPIQVRNPIRATVLGASQIVLAEDAARLDPILIQNLSEVTVYLDFGQPAEVSDGWPLPAGDLLRFTSTLAIHAITAGGAASVAILVGADSQEEGRGDAPSGGAGDPMNVEIVGSVPLNVNVASMPMGTPAGTGLDPLHVETNLPAGTVADPMVTTSAPVGRLVLDPWSYSAAVGEAAARGQSRAIDNPNLRTWQIRHRFSAGATGTGTLHLHYKTEDGNWYILGAMALTNAPTVANGYSQLIEIPAPDGAVAVAAVYSDFVDGTVTIRIVGIE